MPKDDEYDRAPTVIKWIMGAAVGAALGIVAGLAIAPQVQASDVGQIAAGTYILHRDGQPGCTAQVVGTDAGQRILTAQHCVDLVDAQYSINRATFDPVLFDKKVVETAYFAEVIRRDKNADVAVLRLMDQSIVLDAVDIATTEEAKATAKGEAVLIAGYPDTNDAPIGDLVFTDGRFVGLSNAYEKSIKGSFYRTSASVHYGNSGGGLYADIDGTWKLIGITSQLDPSRMWAGSLFATRDAIEKNIRLAPVNEK